jgi:hypothetical protein
VLGVEHTVIEGWIWSGPGPKRCWWLGCVRVGRGGGGVGAARQAMTRVRGEALVGLGCGHDAGVLGSRCAAGGLPGAWCGAGLESSMPDDVFP